MFLLFFLLSTEFSICTTNGAQYNRDVAFDGTNFLVIWEDHRSGTALYHLYGSRVTSSGSVLDPNGDRYAAQNDTVMDQSIAWGGGTYLIAYRDHC